MKALIVGLALIGGATFANADNLRDQIIASNRKFDAAMKRNDMAAFAKAAAGGMTKNFTYVEQRKSQTYDQMFTQMKQGMALMKKVTLSKTSLLSLKQHGDGAIAKTRRQLNGTIMGPDNKIHMMLYDGYYNEAYAKDRGHWKMARMVLTKQYTAMDGKYIGPGPTASRKGH